MQQLAGADDFFQHGNVRRVIAEATQPAYQRGLQMHYETARVLVGLDLVGRRNE